MCVCVLQVLDPGLRAPYVNVNRWFATCVNQPQFKAVLGDVPLCTKMAVFDGESSIARHTLGMQLLSVLRSSLCITCVTHLFIGLFR